MSRPGIPGVNVKVPFSLPAGVGKGQAVFSSKGGALGPDGMPRPTDRVYVGDPRRKNDQSVPSGAKQDLYTARRQGNKQAEEGAAYGKGKPYTANPPGAVGEDYLPRFGKAHGPAQPVASQAGPKPPPAPNKDTASAAQQVAAMEKLRNDAMREKFDAPIDPTNPPMPMARPDPFAQFMTPEMAGMPMPEDVGAMAPDGAVHQGYTDTSAAPVPPISPNVGIKAGQGGGSSPIGRAIEWLFNR